MKDPVHLQLALKLLSGIGPARTKRLVSYCGGVEAVFETSLKSIAKIPGFGEYSARNLQRNRALKAAENERKELEKHGLRTLFYLDPSYPERLRHCDDGPVLLYVKGDPDLNPSKSVAIVGTRNATDYGRDMTERLLEALAPHRPLVVSGLAYGIDIIAHKAALSNGLQTVAVLGNSLDRVYPHHHRSVAGKITRTGGLLSEFETGTKPDRENFPQRNRIVAGLSDAVIVIETGVKGGSMITANLAMGYNRDVFAFPGRTTDPYSSGCNLLVKTNRAALVESIEDIEYQLGWACDEKEKHPVQKQLFEELNAQERTLYDQLSTKGKASLDHLSLESGFTVSRTSSLLLEMEFKGIVKSLPGKVYSLA